jgi:muramoyltetrapeptide carboxypeptidase
VRTVRREEESSLVLSDRLRPGDRVRMVSPASTPLRERVEVGQRLLAGMGYTVEIGDHAFDRAGYLAGTDRDRLADLNDALADPGIKAVIATTGGKGAYRIAAGLDVAAARRHPKLLIGFSEITILHLALFAGAGLPGIHGAPWGRERFGEASARSFVHALTRPDPVTVTSDHGQPTAALTTRGRAHGTLLGGNQEMIATSAGWILPSLAGRILLLEAAGQWLGSLDRQLTMLIEAGHLDGVAGVAVGQYHDCGNPGPGPGPGEWTVIDVLRDRLTRLAVPVLGGLPIGHGPGALAIPIGTTAVLDADTGTLTLDAAIR